MKKIEDRIVVVDSPCGFGKTNYAIQYINSLDNEKKIIYITPFLTECDRIKRACSKKDFHAPDSKRGKGSKLNDFESLLMQGVNIVSTHSLFSSITDEILDIIRDKNYILFLDEVMNVVERLYINDNSDKSTEKKNEELTKKDIETLLNRGIVKIEEDFSVTWISDSDELSKYKIIKELSKRNMLYFLEGCLAVWTFPINVFMKGVFDQIFILTYMFDCQMQAYYYNYFGLEYTKYVVIKDDKSGYDLVLYEDGKVYELEWKHKIKKLIHIYDGEKLNRIGAYYQDKRYALLPFALSKRWYDKASKESLDTLNKNISNYYKNITKSKSADRMWTCFKTNKKIFSKNKEIHVKNWIELNARATNDYAHKNVLVYPINRYLNPFFARFFFKKGVRIDEDSYSVSELIQWIFRSAIRNGREIFIYCPSQRMRTLLIDWLNN